MTEQIPKHFVIIGMGSNEGQRERYLRAALLELSLFKKLSNVICSSIYETPPLDAVGGAFLNLVCVADSIFAPIDLLSQLLLIEQRWGRVRSFTSSDSISNLKEERTLDLDLLWAEGVENNSSVLTLPHPRMMTRSFVRYPLCELGLSQTLWGEDADVDLQRTQPTEIKRRDDLFQWVAQWHNRANRESLL